MKDKMNQKSHRIKKRETPNDVFITPIDLVNLSIEMILSSPNYHHTDFWFDPFRGSGRYYEAFPKECQKDWTEILENKDFFSYDKNVDVICSNPPYSMIDKVLEKSVQLNPRIIQYLIGAGNLTTRRIETMERNNFFITKLKMCKVYSWYGMSYVVQFEKKPYKDTNDVELTYSRKVFR